MVSATFALDVRFLGNTMNLTDVSEEKKKINGVISLAKLPFFDREFCSPSSVLQSCCEAERLFIKDHCRLTNP